MWGIKSEMNGGYCKKISKKSGVREARTLDLRITRSYETYALANCATTPTFVPLITLYLSK